LHDLVERDGKVADAFAGGFVDGVRDGDGSPDADFGEPSGGKDACGFDEGAAGEVDF
jgi:hypothetical protein